MDELYIEKVLKGDTEAYRYFIQQYKDKAFAIAVSILKIEYDARDAVQEAFIIAFEKLDTFEGNSKFSSWFYRIVINAALKQLKEQKQYLCQQIDAIEDFEIIDENLHISLTSLEKDQQKYFIDQALNKVPFKEALALTLFYIQENSIAEVSQMTGWSVSNVKVILSRGRKSMYYELDKTLKVEKKLLY